MQPLPERRRLALPLISAVVAALALVVLPLSPASAAITQGISGTVTAEGGGALQYVWVSAYRDLGGADGIDWVNGTQTDASGQYELSLPSGQYYLYFQSYTTYAPEWWNNATTLGDAAPVTVGAGVTSDVSSVLEPAGHIAGTIAQAVGADSSDVQVFAPDSTDPTGYSEVASGYVDGTTGQYDVGGLRAGQYKVRFEVYGFVPEFWHDRSSIAAADPVFVTASNTTSAISPTLTPYGQVTGTVTLPGGGPAADVDVKLYTHDSYGWHPSWDGDWEDYTDANGHYSIPAPDGTYRVGFESPDPTLQPEFWQNKHRVAEAQDITLTSATTTPNINAQLDEGGHITGTLTQGIGVGGTVQAWVETTPGAGDWYRFKAVRVNKLDGTYAVDGLPSASYKIRFSVSGFDPEWWHDQSDLASASPIPVIAPDTVPNVSPVLTPHVHIAGTVTDPGNGPVSNGYVSAFRFDGTKWVFAKSVGLKADGTYDLNLSSGSYRLRVRGWSADGLTPYATEFFNNAASLARASSIEATTPGQTYGGRDVQLSDAAGLDGTLSFPSATERGRKMDRVVSVYDKATGDLVATTVARFSSSTDTTAAWSIDDLAAGSYRVDFARISGPALPDGSDGSYSAAFDRLSGPALMEGQYYDALPESSGPNSAQAVNLVGGESRYVEATMRLGGVIHGTLVDGRGNGLRGCRVQATSSVAGKLVTRSNITAPDGTFDVTGLSTGDYDLAVLDRGACDHAEYYTSDDGDLNATSSGSVAVHATVGNTTNMPADLLYGADIAVLPITNTSPPTVPAGNPVAGTAVTASPGSWSPSGTALTYQWEANGGAIGGATSLSYTPTAADVGKALSVRVTASKSGYAPTSIRSNSTAPVVAAPAPPPPAPTVLTVIALPKVLGIAKVGKVLKAVPPTVSPAATTVQFQWLRNGKPIKGLAARRAKYKLVRADRRRRISVRITLLRPGYPPSVSVVKKAGKVR